MPRYVTYFQIPPDPPFLKWGKLIREGGIVLTEPISERGFTRCLLFPLAFHLLTND